MQAKETLHEERAWEVTGPVSWLRFVLLVAVLVLPRTSGLAAESFQQQGQKKPANKAATTKPNEKPGVRCVLIVPPGEEPFPDATERLTLVLKDIQWWYSCQMEAHGFGAKTFLLETDKQGNVIVHIVKLESNPGETSSQIRKACIAAATKLLGNHRQRCGTVLLVFYNGYLWTDQSQLKCLAGGCAIKGRWAFQSAWHYYNLNAKAWTISDRTKDFQDRNLLLGSIHAKVLAARYPNRTIGSIASAGYGALTHELGHAFILTHPPKSGHVKGDVMSAHLWKMRGSFSMRFPNEWCCLSARDAIILNSNTLFQVRNIDPPSTGVSRDWGMRGVEQGKAAQAAEPVAALLPGNYETPKIEFKTHCYKAFKGTYTWHQAKEECERIGGHLVCIGSSEENLFVAKLCNVVGRAWIGGTDEQEEGVWNWVNSSPFTFSKWADNQPNNENSKQHYLYIIPLAVNPRYEGGWNDDETSCDRVKGFVCEWDSRLGEPNNQ